MGYTFGSNLAPNRTDTGLQTGNTVLNTLLLFCCAGVPPGGGKPRLVQRGGGREGEEIDHGRISAAALAEEQPAD